MVAGLKADGTVVTTSDWIDVTNWSDIIAISVDGEHITGWKKDGTMLTAGRTHDADFNASSWKDVVAITIGAYNTVGLKRDGTVLVSVSSDHQGVSKASKWKDIEIPSWAK
jgi:alpha-tubulin suppressor-like RCC1 family protein